MDWGNSVKILTAYNFFAMTTASRHASMQLRTAIEDFPQQVQQQHLSPHTEILVIVQESPTSPQATYVQRGDKSISCDVEAVTPEPNSRLVSDIVYDQRKQ